MLPAGVRGEPGRGDDDVREDPLDIRPRRKVPHAHTCTRTPHTRTHIHTTICDCHAHCHCHDHRRSATATAKDAHTTTKAVTAESAMVLPPMTIGAWPPRGVPWRLCWPSPRRRGSSGHPSVWRSSHSDTYTHVHTRVYALLRRHRHHRPVELPLPQRPERSAHDTHARAHTQTHTHTHTHANHPTFHLHVFLDQVRFAKGAVSGVDGLGNSQTLVPRLSAGKPQSVNHVGKWGGVHRILPKPFVSATAEASEPELGGARTRTDTVCTCTR